MEFREATLRVWKRWMLVSALLGATVGGPAVAHHSYAMFDMKQNKTLEGVVQIFKWTNPHSYIEMLVTDGKGQIQTWGVECGAPFQMIRAGWRASSLKSGDRVVVTIHPLLSGEYGGSFVQVQMPDGRVLKAN